MGTPVGTDLDAVNDAFHDAFDAAKREEKTAGPVLVLVGDDLVVFRNDVRASHRVVPRLSHVIKSVAHAPVALFACLHRDARARAPLEALQASVSRSQKSLVNEPAADPRAIEDACKVLDLTAAFLADAMTRETSQADRERFAISVRALLLALTVHATRIQLAALEECADAVLGAFDGEELRTVQVVVTGDHQARERSLGMQYFAKRFGEREGANDRVTFGESVETAEEARALVGTRRLDAAIAAAFFGDPKRLQRDVLGDAVAMLLAERAPASVGDAHLLG